VPYFIIVKPVEIEIVRHMRLKELECIVTKYENKNMIQVMCPGRSATGCSSFGKDTWGARWRRPQQR